MSESHLQILTALADMETLLAGSSVVGLAAIGAAVGPKVGFGRACTLALSSRLFSSLLHNRRSVRQEEVQQVWGIVSNKLNGGIYLVVTGPKGVGKSCMLSTALHRRCGVVTISVRDTLYLYTYMSKASPVHRLNLEKIRTL
jgi:hypothetical protein